MIILCSIGDLRQKPQPDLPACFLLELQQDGLSVDF